MGTCDAGTCAVVSCEPGFKNCNESAEDGGISDGCETDTANDADNCGGCGNACDIENAIQKCANSECVIGGCTQNHMDCNPGEGCETDTGSSVQHCGSCMGTCSNAGATDVSCTNGTCDPPECDSTHRNCDDNNANGCETDITTPDECG